MLALAALALGGLVVVKPAVDHWGELYHARPFAARTTTETVLKQRAGQSTQRTITSKQASGWSAEGVLGKGGLLMLRLGIVALVAFLLAAVVHRVVLGNYTLGAARPPRWARSTAPESSFNGNFEPAEASGAAALPIQNGTTADPTEAGLASVFAKFVTSRREELGLSQRELAKRAGISHTVISRIENEQHMPAPKTMERLADALSDAQGA